MQADRRPAAVSDTGGVEFREVESNLRDSFRVLARAARAGDVRELGGVSIASAGVTFQMFNAAFLATPVATENDLDQHVAMASVHFDARGLEWACWVCEDWMEKKVRRRASNIFRRHGLHLSVELPGMLAERVLPPVHALPRLDIRRVTNEAVRNDFCNVGSACFNVPLPWFHEVFDPAPIWKEFAGYVGYVEGEPVSTAATVIGSGVAGVYNVATLPDYQRHGYGEAVMRHALERAAEEFGISRTILQSTPAGFALYERMGYRTVTSVAVYSS